MSGINKIKKIVRESNSLTKLAEEIIERDVEKRAVSAPLPVMAIKRIRLAKRTSDAINNLISDQRGATIVKDSKKIIKKTDGLLKTKVKNDIKRKASKINIGVTNEIRN